MSSPNLNYIIGLGALVLYVDIYLLVVPTTDQLTVQVLCSLTPWLTAIGYSLCYGIIVAKMVRVYFIFNNPKPKSTTVSMCVRTYVRGCSYRHMGEERLMHIGGRGGALAVKIGEIFNFRKKAYRSGEGRPSGRVGGTQL